VVYVKASSFWPRLVVAATTPLLDTPNPIDPAYAPAETLETPVEKYSTCPAKAGPTGSCEIKPVRQIKAKRRTIMAKPQIIVGRKLQSKRI
jgi:hypothetical protein